jgi:hypothetical protein
MEAYLSPAAFDEARSALEGAEGIAAGHPLERFAKDAGLGRPQQRPGVVFRRNHFGGQGEDVQTVPSRLRPWARDPESSRSQRFSLFPRTYGMPPEPRRLATRFAGATDPEQKWKTGGCSRFYGAPA